MDDYDIVKSDFNEIAELTESKWNHNNCYFNYLLEFVPNNIETTLEIGSGKGELSYLLSRRSEKVIGIDLAEKMTRIARNFGVSTESMILICH